MDSLEKHDNTANTPPKWIINARWASYWINDHEVYEFSAADFTRKAATLRETGVSAVIIFGQFHFRWSYIDDWPVLLDTLKAVCESCHRYDIKVVEHHGAVDTHFPLGADERENLFSRVDRRRHPGFFEIINNGDKLYEGRLFSSMRQIDPRIAEFSYAKESQSFTFCHNNPFFQELYFKHLEDIYAAGVDGIMTDDIRFSPNGYGCGCLFCRRQFKADTGYDLPPSGIDDRQFYGNLENMAYRAWILWRIESHKAHQERVSRHFRGLGLNLVRPIYSSSNTNAYAPRGMGVALDNLDGLYSAIFTEVNSVEPQAHCWLRISAESKQRNALAYRNGVPAMCLFYPHNKDENLFCWAMTKTWGQNYWGTNWGMELSAETEMLKEAFQFENRHSELYLNPKPLSEVGVLYSARATWLHDDRDGKPDYVRMSNPASTDCWAGWCETLTLANILFDTIGENDLEEERYFDRLRLIIVPNAVCLSERAIQSLKKFARAGGHLIVTCQSGLKNEYGAPRDNYPFGDLIGADYMNAFMGDITAIPDVSDESGLKGFSHDNCFICEFHSRPGTKTLLKDSRADLPIVFMNDYGKGSVVTFAFKPGRLVCVNRHQRIEQEGHLYAKIEFTTNIAIENVMTNVTRMLYRRQALETSDVPRGFAINAFGHDANRIVIHIVNAAGTLSDNNKIVPIPAPLSYPSASSLIGGSSAMTIRVRTDATRAILRSPEFPGDVELECSRLNEYLESRIPDTLLRCYSVVELHP